MLWLSFKRWDRAAGKFFSWRRLRIGYRWTPFIVGKKRYDSWFGFWNTYS